jgi:hypothetical protein
VLQFTADGAVATPTTLQVRVGPGAGGGARVGEAPPPRALDAAELVAAVEAFTLGRRGPRTRPCDHLVVSGFGASDAEGVLGAVRRARATGVARVTLHVSGPPQALGDLGERLGAEADAVSGATATEAEVAALAAWPGRRTAVVPLTAEAVAAAPALLAALRAADIPAVAVWPADPDASPAALDDVRALVRQPGAVAGVKGVPACLAPHPEGAAGTWRTANRFVVDAAHQGAAARTLFPDILTAHKAEACRYCVLDGRCDGVVQRRGAPVPAALSAVRPWQPGAAR